MADKFKFDVVIGNPPYQEENKGDNRQAEQVYHFFMQEAYELSEKVTFITRARIQGVPVRFIIISLRVQLIYVRSIFC